MSNGHAVAAYYRVSTARDDMAAPEIYEHEVTRHCTYKRLELARIYSDVNLSAFRGAKRGAALEDLVKNRTEEAIRTRADQEAGCLADQPNGCSQAHSGRVRTSCP